MLPPIDNDHYRLVNIEPSTGLVSIPLTNDTLDTRRAEADTRVKRFCQGAFDFMPCSYPVSLEGSGRECVCVCVSVCVCGVGGAL